VDDLKSSKLTRVTVSMDAVDADIVETLMTLVPKVFECEDDHTRKMSRLVARAFHSHEQGIEYPYLRSKTFRTK
jgi:hypothetical protein